MSGATAGKQVAKRTRQRLDKDLHTTTQAKNQVQSGLLLDVIVGQGATIFELLASKNQALLIWWNSYNCDNISDRQNPIAAAYLPCPESFA